MFAYQLSSPQLFMETSHWELLCGRASLLRTSSWRKKTLSVPCMNAYSSVRTPQSEFALFRESLGVSRINHIL